jgi:hypothetical protein
MAYTEDHIALAAEYALGTLDASERAQVETMMAVDKAFADVVQAWAYRLGVLNQMVGSVEPRPIVWENIRSELARTDFAQETPAPEASPPPPPVPESSSIEAAPPELAPDAVPQPELQLPKQSSPGRRGRHPMRFPTSRRYSCRRSMHPILTSRARRRRRLPTTAMSSGSRAA